MKNTTKAVLFLAGLALLFGIGARAAVYQSNFGGTTPISVVATNGAVTNNLQRIDTVEDGGTLTRLVFTTSFGITNTYLYFINVDDSSVLYKTNLLPAAAGTNAATTYTVTTNLLHGTFQIFASNTMAAAYSNGIFVSSVQTTSKTVNVNATILDIR